MRLNQRCLGVLLAALCAPCFAAPSTVTVDGLSNIFGAGHSTPPAPASAGTGGILPPGSSLPAGSGDRVLTFSSVTGQVCGDHYHFAYNGPDGGHEGGGVTNVSSYGGISGIRNDNATVFLVGVFLGNSEPVDPAPARLNFTGNTSFNDLYPQIAQTFFIGDGLTGTGNGQIQRFHVPAGATRLFFGLADGWAFQGVPGWYIDNTGSFTATFNFTPEPASALLLATGVLFLVRRRGSGRLTSR